MHPFPAVNYLAILVAAIVIFILGGLWYSKILFAKRWIALQGRTEEQMKAQAASANMPLMYLSAFVTAFLTAWVMAYLIAHMGAVTEINAGHGAMFGVICWLGFMATITAAEVAFLKQPWGLWVINNIHNVIVQILMGAIVVGLH